MKTYVDNVYTKDEGSPPITFAYFTIVARDDADKFTYGGVETRIQLSSVSEANVRTVVDNALATMFEAASPVQKLVYIIREKLKM